MILLPAIDLLEGRCVRLRRGDFDTAHQVAADPLETAHSFAQAGAGWIHLVDLDGAKTGDGRNRETILKIARETSLKVETGGGIRDMDTIVAYLENGVARVILGSAALENPQLVKNAVEKYGDRVAVGIDAKNGRVSARGWLADSGVDYLDLAHSVEAAGAAWIIFTDIAKDGMMEGPNLSQMSQLRKAVSCGLVASGGIRSQRDLEALAAMGVEAAILGKALYSGAIDLAQAVRWAGPQQT
ncbi:MAG: 1-(5-phosphoribosyl)-5-[(5-phosphoribosylamino)methylideneamino]imidazole-4-carboxamide isomerase [Oscillospiraceae bacterium]|nr:1-(5-phosphoribosyl)-5-[(5-phosphoribosylamino)methylideneamino]imidazole-4-carboxamide isomerase [Oscillospiraceae bacterium]